MSSTELLPSVVSSLSAERRGRNIPGPDGGPRKFALGVSTTDERQSVSDRLFSKRSFGDGESVERQSRFTGRTPLVEGQWNERDVSIQ